MLALIDHKANLRPNAFTPLSSAAFPPDVLIGLDALYSSPHKDLRLIAGLINHCFSVRTDTIMLSRPILESLIESDPNITDKFTVSAAIYKGLTRYLANEKLLVQLAPSCKRAKGVRGKAAIYQLSEPMQRYLQLTQAEVAAIEECVSALNRS